MALNQSGLLFVPRTWQRTKVLHWLKRIHAWTGLWGAALFLTMGTSGFLLNHRSVLKIETPKPVEVSAAEIMVPQGGFSDTEALGIWARKTLALPVEGRAPPAADKKPKVMLGQPVVEAERWTRVFNLVDSRVTVAYTPGAPSASVKRDDLGTLAFIKNLHKGTGLGIAWVLFLDTIAGALIAMSLTGFLLWTRLHGPRLLAGGLIAGSLTWALLAVVPVLG